MLDARALSLEEFCRESGSRVRQAGARGKFRSVNDAFRSSMWIYLLLQETGLSLSAAQTEFEAAKRGHAVARNGQWSRYRKGATTPDVELVEATRARAPRAARVFEHVVWRTLDLCLPVVPEIQKWLLLTLAGRPLTSALRYLYSEKSGAVLADQLQKLSTFDRLACQIALLRFDVETLRRGWPWDFEMAKTLLVGGLELVSAGIGQALFEYIELFIYPLSADLGCDVLSNHGLELRELSELLYAKAIAYQRDVGNPEGAVHETMNLLIEEVGDFNLLFELLPIPLTLANRQDQLNPVGLIKFLRVKASMRCSRTPECGCCRGASGHQCVAPP